MSSSVNVSVSVYGDSISRSDEQLILTGYKTLGSFMELLFLTRSSAIAEGPSVS